MPTRLIRVGECNQCGKCCDPDTVPGRMEVYRRRGLSFLLHAEPCPYFYYEDGKGVCGIYRARPLMCRVFPRISEDIEALPECGYRFMKNYNAKCKGRWMSQRRRAKRESVA